MESLKLFATYETTLTIALQAEKLSSAGWRTADSEHALECHQDGAALRLEQSGDDLFLLRGDLSREQYTDKGVDAVLGFLHNCAAQFQLDVFEEDGRLTRRISSAD